MPLHVAVEGCCHGELDRIYETLQYAEELKKIKIDMLLICGDFQAVRSRSDLSSMAVPQKYQKLNTFYKYYSGEKVAPVLTIFIGGNHEASNYLQELPYGGWVAPNIYYMGYAGVVQFAGLRIGGLSGIYKQTDYHRGHFEHPPYNESSKRSVYHVRNLEVFRLKQLRQPMDIFLSHDWPRGIYNHGNVQQLLRKKKFLAGEVSSGILGSPPAEELLNALKPNYWFSAHLHVKFPAVVKFQLGDNTTKTTKFLALDKCLPRREFLQILEINPSKDEPKELRLDPEWLAILRSTNHLLSVSRGNCYMPGPGSNERYDFAVTKEELDLLCGDFNGNMRLPENFVQTAEPHGSNKNTTVQPAIFVNPQTALLCEMVGLCDPVALIQSPESRNASFSTTMNENSDFINTTVANPDEISLDETEDDQQPDSDQPPTVDQPPTLPTRSPTPSGDSKSLPSECTENVGGDSKSLPSECMETVVSEKDPVRLASDEEDVCKEEQRPAESSPLCESTPKVFKRRNQAIYGSLANELNEDSS